MDIGLTMILLINFNPSKRINKCKRKDYRISNKKSLHLLNYFKKLDNIIDFINFDKISILLKLDFIFNLNISRFKQKK
jgi:hypothetical protein